MLINNSLRAIAVASFFLSLTATSLLGQATGSISGSVIDASGAPISGAKVTVSGQVSGGVREANTDSAGRYVVPSSV